MLPADPPAPIRVMHVISGLGLGGAETMLVNLARAGRAAGLQPHVVSLLPGGENAERLRADGIATEDLGMRSGRPSLRAIRRLARAVRRHRPQILQSWMYHADLMAWAATRLVPAAERPKLVWGVRCSDMRIDLYRRQLRWVIAACARLSARPDMIIANSAAGRDVHRGLGYRNDRFLVIANGIEAALFRPDPAARAAGRAALGLADDAIAVAHVARVDPMKDHATFLAAMAERPDLAGVLVGRGTDALALPANVTALGARNDVAQLLPAFDIVALSSAFGEGFPNALAEGMAAGLVPVATDVGDCRDIVGETGFVARAGDVAGLAEALAAAAAAARAGGGGAARQRILDRFALPLAVAAFRDAYAGLIAAPCAA
ncbi:MAG: glycosyltransferase [Alphaproteobacteria bacterium]